MALKQPLDASELAALSAYIQQKIWPFCAIIAFAPCRGYSNQLYQRRVKGIEPRDMQPLLNFSTDDGHVKYGNASRAVDTVSRDYPDAGLAGSLAPTKRQYRDNNSSTAEIAPARNTEE